MKKPADRYLGDGVYASFDGYQVVLDLRAQDSTTKIALDSDVIDALNEYANYVKAFYEPSTKEPS